MNLRTLFGTLLFLATTAAQAEPNEINLSHRHIIILSTDIDNIWGSYFFAVNNPSTTPQQFSAKLMLPKEAIDFKPQDGLTNSDLKLGQDGYLFLEKEFPPGLSLMAVGFQVKPARWGDDVLHFSPAQNLEELTIAVPRSSRLSVSAEGFETGLPPMLGFSQYVGVIHRGVIPAQTKIQVQVQGIPKERNQFWLLGGMALILLVLGAATLTYKTRGMRQEEDVFFSY